MLQIRELCKSFGAVKAVHEISLDVAKREVVGLLGPNGAGKSTTMRLITGFLKPDRGTIRVGGIDVMQHPQEAQAQIGYLPENAPTYHEMEVTDFLTYAATLRKLPKQKIKSALKEVIGLCALGDVVGRPIGQLSRGYKQRVGLAQALLHQPKLLILDEPTTGLDPHQIQEIRALIREIGKERTVILSTHIMQEVQAVCSRALIIARGQLVGSGTIEELLAKARGGMRYQVKIRATLSEIEKNLGELEGFKLEPASSHIPSEKNGVWQSLVMTNSGGNDRSEEIFRWVVKNQWGLKELKSEETSLEQVFLELTKK